jgi:hypothetical protein
MYKFVLGSVFALYLLCFQSLNIQVKQGICFTFKQKKCQLEHPMRTGSGTRYLLRGERENRRLDTLSNWFDSEKNYVEIVRQDDPLQPHFGVALGFEFDEENGDYPYSPSQAIMQLKDFEWGGLEFSLTDTMNYTGVSNTVSDDLVIEVDGFAGDTIWGRFSGLLLSGAGPMAQIENGTFIVRVYRK